MLFRRRNPPRWSEKLRVWLWPRRNWKRSSRYITHRLRRLRASPHEIALGCAIGVFSSFTPFFGLQFIFAALLAWMTRSSILASALGTFFGNPLTFPFMWYGSYHLGNWVLGLTPKSQDTIDLSGEIFGKSYDQIWPILQPLLVGALPLGLIFGTIAYFLVRKAAEAYRNKRQARTENRPTDARAAA